MRLAWFTLSAITIFSIIAGRAAFGAEKPLEFDLQTRDPKTSQVTTAKQKLDPKKTGIVVVDPWNFHWCMTACQRVEAMVPRWNRALQCARKLGMQVMWAPTDVASQYVGTPQRERALAVEYLKVPRVRDLACRFTCPVGPCMCGPGIACRVNYGWDGMAPANLRYKLEPEYDRFVALAGVDDNMLSVNYARFLAMHASVVFKVFIDGRCAAESPVMRMSQEPWRFDVKIPDGARQINLVATDAGSRSACDLGNWADAGFVRKGSAGRPPTVRVPGYWEQNGRPITPAGSTRKNPARCRPSWSAQGSGTCWRSASTMPAGRVDSVTGRPCSRWATSK